MKTATKRTQRKPSEKCSLCGTTGEIDALISLALQDVGRNISNPNFLREISKRLLQFSGCDALDFFIQRKETRYYSQCSKIRPGAFRFKIQPLPEVEDKKESGVDSEPQVRKIYQGMISGRIVTTPQSFTDYGSFYVADTKKPVSLKVKEGGRISHQTLLVDNELASTALIPLFSSNEQIGYMQLKSKKAGYLGPHNIPVYEIAAKAIAVALVSQHIRHSLQERVKELGCLYAIRQLALRPEFQLEQILSGIVRLLPPAWQYPRHTSARIMLHGRSCSTAGFQHWKHKQTADIIISGEKSGYIEVVYTKQFPQVYEGPFLKEERSLIEAVAAQVALIVERRQAETERAALGEQLRHADRLATIGQLAAGVAHELNEPLGNILGFAQLAQKDESLSEQLAGDINKIVRASLYSREVIKKLMLFARQVPTKKTEISLNQTIEESLYFFQARCTKAGVELVCDLTSALPLIIADKGQLMQVLINLVVNAMQAMPAGGKITISTSREDHHVVLIVEDVGIGMDQETQKQIFMPFFTTKSVDQGTGLGLAVVHGIVSSHRGTISVKSQPGEGARFAVKLPIHSSNNTE